MRHPNVFYSYLTNTTAHKANYKNIKGKTDRTKEEAPPLQFYLNLNLLYFHQGIIRYYIVSMGKQFK